MRERHNFKVGDRVTVFNRSFSKFVIEGRAKIVSLRAQEDMYRVRFDDDAEQGHKHTWLRFVDPNGQEDPEAYLASLKAGGAR